MTKFSDVLKTNITGYPKNIYDDGKTKLEVWKIYKMSQLTLLIANELFSEGEIGAVKVKINGVECVCLKPPRKMNPQIKDALQDERFETQGEDDIEATTEFLIIRLCQLGRVNILARIIGGWMNESDFPIITATAARLITSPIRICDAREPDTFLNVLFHAHTHFDYAVCDWNLSAEEKAEAYRMTRDSQIKFLFSSR